MQERYSIGTYEFKSKEFFPEDIFSKITDIRVSNPGLIEKIAASRKRRPALTTDGRLTILAADHPARMVTRVGDDPVRMGDRHELLSRILRVVTSPEIDGIMGTPDIIEELMVVDYLYQEAGGESFLANKVLLGCMNRGGLAGVSFEMDDRMTAYTAPGIKKMRLDGAKIMFRLEVTESASGLTIEYCSKVINELADLGIPVFLEALAVVKEGGAYKTRKNSEDLIKVIGVASGLGYTSAMTWLKIPYCDNYEAVARATTCPILMLGGESKGDPTPTIEEFAKGMKAGPTIRGALVGRNVTFPGNDDPRAVACAINGIVHRGFSAEEAVDYLMSKRGTGMDDLTRILK